MLFIINPAAARGTTLRMWARARGELLRRGVAFTERFTSRAGDAAEITRQALQQGASRVIAVGGDGTLNEVVNGYLDQDGQPVNRSAALGLLSSGTGSDFRRSLGLRTREDQLRALARSSLRRLDAARAVLRDRDGAAISRCFINLASVGLGGDVAALVNEWRAVGPKWIGGRARFMAAVVQALKRYRAIPVRVTLDEEREVQLQSNLLVIANGRFAGGGMMLAPHAELDDGLLEVVLTDRATRLDVLKELPRIQRGAYLTNPKVSETRARTVSLTSDRALAIDLDGELAGYSPADFSVLPGAIQFLV